VEDYRGKQAGRQAYLRQTAMALDKMAFSAASPSENVSMKQVAVFMIWNASAVLNSWWGVVSWMWARTCSRSRDACASLVKWSIWDGVVRS